MFKYGFFYLPVYINMLPTLSNSDNKSQNCLKDNSVGLNYKGKNFANQSRSKSFDIRLTSRDPFIWIQLVEYALKSTKTYFCFKSSRIANQFEVHLDKT